MTPLEELQAAHKRLSELRDFASPPTWSVAQCPTPDDEQLRCVETGGATSTFVAEYVTHPDADLIVTLHRTIGAQLEVLDAEIGWERAHHELYGQSARSDSPALSLARALNGDYHDHPNEAHDHRVINGEAS